MRLPPKPPWWLIVIFLIACLAGGLVIGLQFVHP